MEKEIDLTVNYDGDLLRLKGQLVPHGYITRVVVEVDGRRILFEPDEERNFMAIMPEMDEGAPLLNLALVEAIAEALEADQRISALEGGVEEGEASAI